MESSSATANVLLLQQLQLAQTENPDTGKELEPAPNKAALGCASTTKAEPGKA
jgi:hypothetical protein